MNKRTRRLAFGIAALLLAAAALFARLSGEGSARHEADTAAGTAPAEGTAAVAGASAGDTQGKAGADVPIIRKATANAETVGLYDKFELNVELEADYDNPYDPAQIDLSMELMSPGGKKWRVNGFYDGTAFAWKARFSPDEAGKWSYRLRAAGRGGEAMGPEGTFTAVPSDHRGWIGLSRDNPRFLEYRDGTSFYGVGVAYPWNITEDNLDKIAANGGNLVTYWNGNYDQAGGGGGASQLESVRFGIGKIDPLKAKRIDDLLEAFEKRGLHMNFVIWPHDSLADQLAGWPAAWRQNAYSTLGAARDFYASDEMWAYQERLYRYIIARWGYSRALGIWDLICEINGTDGWAFGDPEAANAWVEKAHRYFKEHDPYGHPTMGSMAGNRQDVWDFGYKTLDLADRENYYDLGYEAYAADIGERWNRYAKPLMIGETGNVSDVRKYHDAIWVSLASGLASTPIWWEFGQVNDDMFAQMKHLADFVADLDFREPRDPVHGATDGAGGVQAWAMRGETTSYGWMSVRTGTVGKKTVSLPDWPAGPYTVSWVDPWTGAPLGDLAGDAAGGKLKLTAPATERPDLAFTIRRGNG
jgi:hypothetical protein